MTTEKSKTMETAPDPTRRVMLGALLASYVCAFIPGQLAHAQQVAASGGNAGALRSAPDAFLSVTHFLTGRALIDEAHAARLYAALVAVDPTFDTKLHDLAAWIAQHRPEPAALQAALDDAKLPFAKVPKDIVTAWYVGVVGSGAAARCVSFETSLMYVAVADRLKPPSYAYGPYASWGRNPITA
jgi:hypothetical protein